MKVEAIKVENGFLIPFNESLKKIKQNKILLEVEVIISLHPYTLFPIILKVGTYD